LIVFNLVGLGMLAAGFGIAVVIGGLTGFTEEGPVMIMAGPLLLLLDLTYRLASTYTQC
jgi:hypothetical protein